MKNRWLIAASAVGIHISIGSVYAWSVFNLPLENAFGWTKSDVAITFSLAIFFLGMSAAVMGRFVERKGPRTSGIVAACLWGLGLVVASLGVKLGVIQILWLGYGVLGGMGLGIGYITPVSTLVKWFPDRRGLATGLAIMGFGFGAALGGPVYNYIMSDVAASKLGMPDADYRVGITNYNAAKTILKAIHVHNDSAAGYSMEQLLGYPRDQVLNQMVLSRFFSAPEAARFHSELRSERFGGKNRLSLFETLLITASGREIPVQLSAAAMVEGGRENGLVGFFRDLRETRRLERELADQARILHQDKMMSLGRLAASVVHEINNPLSGILNYARLMARVLQQGDLTSERREKFQRYLGIVETETSRCSQIVSNLLSFSRRSPEAFAPVDVAELIQRCLILSRHKLDLSNIRLETAIQQGLPPVEGDFNQLQQGIINLIFNAIDAMPQGGTLTLEAQAGDQASTVSIRVQDTGPGIPPEHLSSIFEPFFTTKSDGHGLGLGLSTVYGIVVRHHGSIEACNTDAGGALFAITLPRSRKS